MTTQALAGSKSSFALLRMTTGKAAVADETEASVFEIELSE